MKMNKKKHNKNLLVIIGLLIVCIAGVIIVGKIFKREEEYHFSKPNKYTEDSFNLNLIKTVNSTIDNQNYLISPYSIEYALNMLREATDNNTLKEINEIVPKRTIKDLSTGKKIGVANALFIKNSYKDKVTDTFTNTLKKDYKSEIIYDDFNTPKVINDWVNKKTNHMIPKILDRMNKAFILGIANAVAIDVEWEIPFQEDNTEKEEFTLENGTKIKTDMMHNFYTNRVQYFKDDKKEGVIIPYKSDENDKYELELIAYLPKGKIKNFIENITEDDIDIKDDIIDKSNLRIYLSIPKFEYDFDLENFMEVLQTMGINDVFDSNEADLSRALQDTKAYV